MRIEPYILPRLPQEMVAKLVQQLTLQELQDLVESNPPLVETLRGVVELFIVREVQDAHATVSKTIEVFKQIDYNTPIETASPAPVSIVVIAKPSAFPWRQFRRRFLSSHHKKFILFPDHSLWTANNLDGFTLGKIVGYFEDEDTTLMSTSDSISLNNCALSSLQIMPFSGAWTSLALENVRITGRLNPFRDTTTDSVFLGKLSQLSLELLLPTIETASKLVMRPERIQKEDPDFFYITHLDGLRSVTLKRMELYGISQLEDWDLPSLEHLVVSFDGSTDYCDEIPGMRRLKLPNLKVLELTTTSQIKHVEEELLLGENCQRTKINESATSTTPSSMASPEKATTNKPVLYAQLRDSAGVPVKSLIVKGTDFPKGDTELLLGLEHLYVDTKSIDEEVAVFRSKFRDLRTLKWRVSGGTEIRSVKLMQPPCLFVTDLIVEVDEGICVHYDLSCISKSFPNVQRLTLDNSYHNRKLISLKDMCSTMKFAELTTITLRNFPEEVIDVFKFLDAPKLKEIFIHTLGGPLLQTSKYELCLHSSSVVGRIGIFMDKSPLEKFEQMSRSITFASHAQLRELEASHFNSVVIAKCPSLSSILINNEKTPLTQFIADGLPECKNLSYTASRLQKGLKNGVISSLSPQDQSRIEEIEKIQGPLHADLRRTVTPLYPDSPYVTTKNPKPQLVRVEAKKITLLPKEPRMLTMLPKEPKIFTMLPKEPNVNRAPAPAPAPRHLTSLPQRPETHKDTSFSRLQRPMSTGSSWKRTQPPGSSYWSKSADRPTSTTSWESTSPSPPPPRIPLEKLDDNRHYEPPGHRGWYR